MPTIDDWKRLKTRYTYLKSDTKKVLDELKLCSTDSSNAELLLSNAIIYDDDDSVDAGKIQSIDSSINSMKTKLENKVIPALPSKIYEINREIENASAVTDII